MRLRRNRRPINAAGVMAALLLLAAPMTGWCQSECTDGIDNDADGLVDWQYDLGCHGPGDDAEAAQSRSEENGWTTYDPASDTVIIYVSSAIGDDAHDGRSPQSPVASIARGLALIRDGSADWLLFRRGDTWSEGFNWGERSGRSDAERLVVASYGDSTERPRFATGSGPGISICCDRQENVSFIDLDFHAHTRDPASPDFQGSQGSESIRRCCGGGGNLLFEGNRFRSYVTTVLQTGSDGIPVNIEFRRNVVADNYGVDSHSQGVYAANVDGLLIEGNVFDHNGWNETVAGADATIFNHNLYLNGFNVRVRDNLILRASSMGIKFRSDGTDGMLGVDVVDNLFVEGEIGIGIGGNTNQPERFGHVEIRDNVLTHIGRTSPTGRDFAWYVDVIDNRDVTIENNHFLHQPLWTNAFGIHLRGGSMRNARVADNTFHDLRGRSIQVSGSPDWSNVRIEDNRLEDVHGSPLIEEAGDRDALDYSGNEYCVASPDEPRFDTGSGMMSLSEWRLHAGETDAELRCHDFPDPARSVTGYQASVGGSESFVDFVRAARLQSKWQWRRAYTAPAVNDYLREGFLVELFADGFESP
jgi:hypothetical protein